MFIVSALFGIVLMISVIFSWFNTYHVAIKASEKLLSSPATAQKMIQVASAVYGLYVSFDVYDAYSVGFFSPNPASNLSQLDILPKNFNDRTPDGGQIVFLNFRDPCDSNVIDVLVYVDNFGASKTKDIADEQVASSMVLNDVREVVNLLQSNVDLLSFPQTYDACSKEIGKGVKVGYLQKINGSVYLQPHGLKLDVNFSDINGFINRPSPAILISAPAQVGYHLFNVNARSQYFDVFLLVTSYTLAGLAEYLEVIRYLVDGGFSFQCPEGAIDLSKNPENWYYYYAYHNVDVKRYFISDKPQFCIPVYRNEYVYVNLQSVTHGINTARVVFDDSGSITSIWWYPNSWNISSAPGISNGVGLQNPISKCNCHYYLGMVGKSRAVSVYSRLTGKYYVLSTGHYANMAGSQVLEDAKNNLEGNYLYTGAWAFAVELSPGQVINSKFVPQIGDPMLTDTRSDSYTTSVIPYCSVSPTQIKCTFPLVQADGTFKYTCNSTNPNCATIPLDVYD